MLFLHQANRLENLFTMLLEQRAELPEDPLESEVIVTPNPGMTSWVCQQIATQQTIAANIRFPTPPLFIRDIIGAQGYNFQEDSRFTSPVMRWRILDLLATLLEKPQFSQLKAYLQDDADFHKSYQLSSKISALFNKYLLYRPEMLLDWERNQEDHWQAELWRRLTLVSWREEPDGSAHTTIKITATAIEPRGHKARLIDQFRTLASHNRLTSQGLAERVFIFGISSLAPVYLEIIAAISKLIDIHIFHLDPCRYIWEKPAAKAETAPKTKWVEQRFQATNQDPAKDHSLLTSLGTVGAEFKHRLMGLELSQNESYQPAAGETLLARIQNDILELEDPSQPESDTRFTLSKSDRSLQFQICHSPLREVQVLHDCLLELFATNPELKPGDVLVMAPDMECYSTAVTGIWGHSDENLRIPWHLADSSQVEERPIIRTFLELLEIISGRFSGAEVLALLETEALRNRFGIDEQGLVRIRDWIMKTGICWGLDQQHRQELGVANSKLNTWAFGLNRMLLGYLTGPQDDPYQDILPWPGVRDSEAEWLGSLATLMEQLGQLRVQFSKKHSPKRWRSLLEQLLADFFLPGNDDLDRESVALLSDTIATFEEHCNLAGFKDGIDLKIIQTLLDESLSKSLGNQAFLTGKVTFCRLMPGRSIPFKVICLLGMNDADYPRSQRPLSFDLMAKNPQSGDQNRRNDERYFFLETLLAARDNFYVSWIGRNQNDNSILPPSVVVDELRNYLDRSCCVPLGSPCEQLSTEHPLQPFSPHCFDETATPRSYGAAWMPPEPGPKTPRIFLPEALEAPEDILRQVDIKTLARFWSHPVRFFLQERIGLQLWEDDDDLPESEIFDCDNLEQYLLGQEIVRAQLDREDSQLTHQRLEAAGVLPHNGFGNNLFDDLHKKLLPFGKRLRELLVEPLKPAEISTSLGDFTLNGWLDKLHEGGRVSYRHAKLKTKDLLQLWVHHLALNLAPPKNCKAVSTHVALDCTVTFQPLQKPSQELLRLLNLYFRGLSEPLHFFPETSWAYFQAKDDKKDWEAEKKWQGGYMQQGEKEDSAYEIALRGSSALDQDFIELTTIFESLANHLEKFNAST